MFTNQLDAIKYFRHVKVKDVLDHANKDSPAFGYDMGFFARLLNMNKTIGDCKVTEALVVANIIKGSYPYTLDEEEIFKENFDIPFFAERLDKYLSSTIAMKLAYYLGIDADGEEFDPSNPFYMRRESAWIDFFDDMYRQVDRRFGASLLATAQAYFQSEYNPIENYSMEQVETPDITHTKSGTSSETETPNITETIHAETNSKLKTDGSSSGNVYGFGSSASTPLNEGESSQTTQGSKDDNYTDSERRETGTRSVSGSSGETEKETGTRRLTRSGNIGVTTSQQMLQSEIELRKFDFLEEVFKCFDKVICASVY